jgi:hypothetical protein
MKYQTGLLDKLGEYPIGGQGHFMTLLFQTHSHTDERQYIIATSIGAKATLSLFNIRSEYLAKGFLWVDQTHEKRSSMRCADNPNWLSP